jgi:hypothetical protein
MFSNLKNFWNKNGLTILVVGSIVVILLLWLFKTRNNEGSYSSLETLREEGIFNASKMPTIDSDIFGKKKKRPFPRESKGETKCREVLQKLFDRPFDKIRPDFLFNGVTGENLEFDMFDIDLMLAVEYNGQQHYKFNSFMHRGSRDVFQNQQYRDRIKRESAKKLGIILIEVPYTVKIDDIEEYLIAELKKHNYKV